MGLQNLFLHQFVGDDRSYSGDESSWRGEESSHWWLLEGHYLWDIVFCGDTIVSVCTSNDSLGFSVWRKYEQYEKNKDEKDYYLCNFHH